MSSLDKLDKDLEIEQESRPWTASTTTTANALEADKSNPSSRAHSDASKRKSRKRLSIDTKLSALPQTERLTAHRGEIDLVSPKTSPGSLPTYSQPIQTTQPKFTLRIPDSENDLHADLHWEINAQNPRNWGWLKKWIHTLIPCAVAWVFSFGATTIAPAHDTIKVDLKISSIVAVLPFSLYVLGLVVGPALSGIGTEMFGRKNVYMMCVPFYSFFILVSGLVRIVPGLLLCRFFAGVFCSPALHMGFGSLSDLWIADEIVLPTTLYVSSVFLGSTFGPVLGGYLIWKETWRWTQYVVLFALGGCLIPIMCMRETSRRAILRLKHGQTARAPIGRAEMSPVAFKPMEMLFSEPIVFLYSLYVAFNFGVLYAVYTAFPRVLAFAEHFSVGAQGLSFLGMSIGVILGLVSLILYDSLIYRPRVARYKEERATDDEKTLQTGRRAGKTNRLSFGPSNEQIKLNTIGGSPDEGKRNSLLRSLRRFSVGACKSLDVPPQDPQKNILLAVAATKYLNSIEANEGKQIMPERVLLLLNQNLEYGHLCVALEGYKLKLDRVELARVLVEAITGSPEDVFNDAIKSSAQHREAAAAALESGPSSSTTLVSTTPLAEKRKTWIPPSNIPPPEWRLWISLPASAILAASLFMLGWTSHPGIHFIAPIIAMCLFSFSSLIAYIGTTLYIMECYGPIHSAAAIAGSSMLMYVFGAAFPLFAIPMYERLHPGLATSLFAFVGIALGLIPSLLYGFGPALRKRRRYKETK